MTKIMIGKAAFMLSRPGNIDGLLTAALGVNAAEAAAILRGHPQAHHVARAMLPLLDADAAAPVALADMIAEHGVNDIAAKVAAILEEPAERNAANGK